jgi:N-acetylneuraminic acid mutarotase
MQRLLYRKNLRALFVLTLTTTLLTFAASAQTNEWTWVGGPQTPTAGIYGQLGTPSANNLPGNREAPISWTDSKGNLWLFGGNSSDSTGKIGYLNDLWEYNPSINEWTWIGGSDTIAGASGVYGSEGISAAGNIPPGRSDAVSWTDTQGNLWIFGGYSFNGYFNDLWKFDPSTNEWTWMAGSDTTDASGVYGTEGTPAVGNIPGARMDAVSWTDSKGDFWLFGGHGQDSAGSDGFLNDLWKFNPATSEWTWMGGSNTVRGGDSGVYGEQGTPAVANMPGGRSSASRWTDSKGNFWLFGGLGYDSSGNMLLLNDLWEFNPTTGEWAWMGGNSTGPTSCFGDSCGIAGVYGTVQTPSAANFPGSRLGAISWTDSKGNFWLFGGDGIDAAGKWGYLNDLWEFNPATNEWAWMGGDSTVICASTYCGQLGVYGTLQTSGLGNTPGGRDYSASWTDNRGNLWLFGGQGVNIVGVWGYLQDLWEFQPNTNGQPITATPTFSPQPGTYASAQTVSINDSTPGATISYIINGNTPATEYSGPITVSSSETIVAIASASGYASSNVATAIYTIQAIPAATPVFSPQSGTYQATQTVTISDSSPGTTIYYTTDGSIPTASSAAYTGPITVSSSETINAVAVGNDYLYSAIASAVYTIGSGSSLGEWVWIGGSNVENQSGSYGTLGVAATGNIPAARSAAASWTDKSGNFWLFGGSYPFSLVGGLNDLWEFNPSSRQWTWMSGSNSGTCTDLTKCGQPGVYGTLGVPARGNTPGGRWGASTWTDGSGHLWLFGGNGQDINGDVGELNDLWEFNSSTDQWTWVGGSSTVNQPGVYGVLGTPASGSIPGGRNSAASWMDINGNFWLFGGEGEDIADDVVALNDLWEFSTATNQWVWMGGSDLVDPVNGYEPGAYGTLGVPAADNIPGSRQGAATWVDKQGKLWLFGGMNSVDGNFNDLWRYDPSSDEWTWMAGASAPYCPSDPLAGGYDSCSTQPAVNGSLGIPAPGNTPSGGSGFAAWTDQNGNLWLFGGQSSDITRQNDGFYIGDVNALWVFNPAIGEWAWMGGNYAASNCSFVILDPLPLVVCDDSPGNFGTLLEPAPGNIPGSRTAPVYWTDTSGNFWLFSGAITDVNNTAGEMNDLWEYQPSTVTLPTATTPIFSLKAGTYTAGGPLAISNGMPNASIYYTNDGTTPTANSTLYTGPINLASSETIQAISTASGYGTSAVASATYTFPAAPTTPTFSVPPGTYNSVQSVALSDATTGAEIVYTTDGTQPTSSSTATIYSQPITVATSETINAIAANPSLGFFVLDGIAADYGPYVASADAMATYTIDLPQLATPSFSIPSGTYTAPQTVAITDSTAGAIIYYTINGTVPTTASTVYTAPITVSSSETIEAIATANGYANSTVASAQYTLNLPNQDFSIAAVPSSLTLGAGQSGSVSVSVTPLNGFSSTVSFACSGLPSGATCSFSPTTVTPSGATVTSQLTIAAAAQSAALQSNSHRFLSFTGIALLFSLFSWKKRRLQYLGLVTIALLGLGLISACGSSGNSSSGGSGGGSGTQPATSIVTVTATAGTLSHAAQISLTIE